MQFQIPIVNNHIIEVDIPTQAYLYLGYLWAKYAWRSCANFRLDMYVIGKYDNGNLLEQLATTFSNTGGSYYNYSLTGGTCGNSAVYCANKIKLKMTVSPECAALANYFVDLKLLLEVKYNNVPFVLLA